MVHYLGILAFLQAWLALCQAQMSPFPNAQEELHLDDPTESMTSTMFLKQCLI